MKLPRHSITTKLLLLFLFVGITVVTIIGSYSFYSAKNAIIERTIDQLISVRAVKKQQVEYFFNEKIKNTWNLSQTENIDNILRQYTGSDSIGYSTYDFQQLRKYYTTYRFSNMYIISEVNGKPKVLALDTLSGNIISSNTQVQIDRIIDKVRSGSELIISDMFFKDGNDSLPVCLIGHVIQRPAPFKSGTVVMEIPATEINRIMLQDNSQIGLGKSGEAYLVGNDYLMRSASRFINESVLIVPVNTLPAESALGGNTGTAISLDYRGIKVFSAYEPLAIPGVNWIVLAEIDYDEALIPVLDLRNDILLVSVVISVFILGFAQLISKMVTQPIIRLKNAAARLGQGDFDNKVSINSRDEIGLFAETFNTMSDQVREERRKRLLALFEGQEIERRRISRELHDGLGQKLVGTKLQIENCDEFDATCLKGTIAETKTGISAIIEELRRISNDLMPAALDELGLETALSGLCSSVSKQSGIETMFDMNIEKGCGGNTAIFLFRIAQEGMQKILKHANASTISMQLIERKGHIIFILEDDGIGFDPAHAKSGNGLTNMKERAGLLGGTFTIESGPGNGTTIRVKIPNS